jgi:phosphatidylserine/phosphatidylglycerophosphate/cardiolipin synthase-like enzyme
MRISALVLSVFLIASPALAAETEVAFSPHGGGIDLILKVIARSQRTIHVAAYWFLSKQVAKALVDAHKRGVSVWVLVDRSKNKGKKTAVKFVAENGIPVRLNGAYSVMHNKFLIADGRTVQTGSFNYTGKAARENAENVLVVWDDEKLARKYETEWLRLWDEGKTFTNN